MLKRKEPTTDLFVRAIKVKNKKFLNTLAKEYDYKVGEVLNTLLDKQRSIYENRKANRKRSVRTTK